MSTPGFYIHEIDKTGTGSELSSRFIPTPSKKRVRIYGDLTKGGSDINDFVYSCASGNVVGLTVRIDFKTFQDEAQRIDPEKIKSFLFARGVKKAEINIIRVPRENTRSEKILTLEKLRDKVVERAMLNQEIVAESVLFKADLLETESAETVIANIGT